MSVILARSSPLPLTTHRYGWTSPEYSRTRFPCTKIESSSHVTMSCSGPRLYGAIQCLGSCATARAAVCAARHESARRPAVHFMISQLKCPGW
jgi:hypothetical protein